MLSLNYTVFGIQFFEPGMDHEGGGMHVKTLFYDGKDGSLLGDEVPWEGTAADIFVQLQFPLHSRRILGVPGRILMSRIGLVVAMLSVAGVYIWWKKRRARRLAPTRMAVSGDAELLPPQEYGRHPNMPRHTAGTDC